MSTPATQASSPSAGLVIAGYLCAVLIPIVGVVLGVTALKKYDGVGTNHGHWIIGVAIASFVLGFLMLASASSPS